MVNDEDKNHIEKKQIHHKRVHWRTTLDHPTQLNHVSFVSTSWSDYFFWLFICTMLLASRNKNCNQNHFPPNQDDFYSLYFLEQEQFTEVMTSTHPCPQCSNLTTSSHYHYPAIICKYVYMYYVLSWPLDQIPINTQDVYERYAVAGLARRWPNYYQDTWVDLQMCKVSRILQCLPSPRWTNLHCETIRCLRITSLEIHPILIKYTHTKKYIFHVIYIII